MSPASSLWCTACHALMKALPLHGGDCEKKGVGVGVGVGVGGWARKDFCESEGSTRVCISLLKYYAI